MAGANLSADDALLREVSRSFYLTIHHLPEAMRPAIAAGYLLARASDSVADTSTAPPAQRRAVLGLMRCAATGRADADDLERLFMQLSGPLAQAQPKAEEYRLLRRFGDCLLMAEELPAQQRTLVREVLGTIIAAQAEDTEAPQYTEAAETLRYADAVAGCVGVFWTRLGYAAMGEQFADPAEQELMEQAGLRYGRGLQLINMLRDEEEDAARGRRYLAGASRELWCDRAERYLRDGVDYARRLRTFRLRFATLLPALLGLRTLRLLRRRKGAERVKISRAAVYRCMLAALLRSL
ncbi:MAG: squalene/phytoene synthase family protein [Akkermansia sp.]|nr:squalene/phytoene synthase family protein [Akkermansia sp.]